MKSKLSFFLLLSFWMFHIQDGYAQEKTRILFVFDASNSMNGYWQNSQKITLAVKLLNESVEKLRGVDNLELALRVYGHNASINDGAQDCDDTELLVPFGKYRQQQIKDALRGIVPKGTTPIARSLEKSAGDFGDEVQGNNVIILITDGVEACDQDPCAVSRALQEKGITLKPFIIGIGIEEEIKFDLACIGNFFDATNAETFSNVLDIVIHQAINNTTVQVNLNDDNKEPKETNVPITFYDNHSKEVKYDFIHTMNRNGHPDTLPIDPVFRYDLYVHTIPEVSRLGIDIRAGKHNTIEVAAGQGTLNLKIDKNHAYRDLKCLVKQGGTEKIIHVQDFNTAERYLTGNYDLEILTLPRTRIDDVSIVQSEKYDIIIPQPGQLALRFQSLGYASIFVLNENKYELVTHVNNSSMMERIILQPGMYKLVFRSKNSKEAIYTEQKEFEIISGQSKSLEF